MAQKKALILWQLPMKRVLYALIPVVVASIYFYGWRSLVQLAEMGAVIAPPVPAFYTRPQSLDDMVTQSVSRALDQFGLDPARVQRWQGG